MKKILFLMLSLFLMGGANSVKAGKVYADLSKLTTVGGTNATWDGETNTITWIDKSNNMVSNFDFAAGDYSSYESIVVSVSNLSNAIGVRVQIRANGKEKTKPVNGEGITEISLSDFGFAEGDLESVQWIRLLGSGHYDGESHTINSDTPASAKINYVYLYMPPTLHFDAYGKATTTKDDLLATGGLSYDPSTGVLTSDGTAGELKLEFAEPVDLKYLFHFNVSRSSDNDKDKIVDNLQFYDEDDHLINTWNSIKWSNTWNPAGIDDNATNAFINNKPVKKLIWPSSASASKAGLTLTINSIEWTLKTMSCAKAGETQLNTLPYKTMAGASTTPAWNINTATSTYYGSVEGGSAVSYVDVTEYDEVRIYRDNNDGFRAFFVNSGGTAVNNIDNSNAASSWNAEGKYWSIDLSKVEKYGEKVALQGIKSAASWIENAVKDIVAYKTPAVNAAKYTLTGSGMQLAETVAALADATATSIDATGVIGITTNSEGGRTLLESANPNCLFLGKVGNGYLANTNNVVDGDACTNLVLTDGYPFKAPVDFTATTASYTTTINTKAQVGTLCLPFAAAIPEGVTAWTLAYTGGAVAEATKITTGTIPANTPVLLNGSGSASFTGSSVEIDADASNVGGALTGVFKATTVPENSYVLQDGDSGVGFYKVTAGDPITAAPFRAYLSNTSNGARSIRVVYGGVTGVNNVNEAEATVQKNGAYFENGKIAIYKNGMKFNANGARLK